MSYLQSKKFWIPVLLLVILAGAFAALWLKRDAALTYAESRFLSGASEQLGYQIKSSGKTTYNVGRNITFKTSSLSIQLAGRAGKPIATIAAVEGSFAWSNLLRLRTIPDRLTLIEPQLNLEEDERRIGNWTDGQRLQAQGFWDTALRIQSLEVKNGQIQYRNAVRNQSESVQNIQIQIRSEREERTARGTLKLDYAGETATGTFTAKPRNMFLGIGPVDFSGSVRSLKLKGDFDGVVLPLQGTWYSGKVSIAGTDDADAPVVRKLDLAGIPFRIAKVQGSVEAKQKLVSFQNVLTQTNAGSAIWRGTLDLRPTRPLLTLEGQSKYIDLTVEKKAGRSAITGRATGIPSELKFGSPYAGLAEHLSSINRLPTEQRGLAPSQEESAVDRDREVSLDAAPFGFDNLPPWDVDATLNTERVRRGDVELAGATLAFTSEKVSSIDADRTLEQRPTRTVISLSQAGAESTSAFGELTINSGGDLPKPEVSAKVRLRDMPGKDVASLMFGEKYISGLTSVRAELTASGANLDELIGSLSGAARLTVEDGAIHGYDLRRIILSWGGSSTYSPARKTAFSNLQANFKLKNGNAISDPRLAMDGQDVRAEASGLFDMIGRNLRYKAKINISPPPLFFPIPIRIEGPWEKPSIKWDWSAVFSAPGRYATPRQVLGTDVPDRLRKQMSELLEGSIVPNDNAEAGPEAAPVPGRQLQPEIEIILRGLLN